MAIKVEAFVSKYNSVDQGTLLTQADITPGTIAKKANRIQETSSGSLASLSVNAIPGVITFSGTPSSVSSDEVILFSNGTLLRMSATTGRVTFENLDGVAQVLYNGSSWVISSLSVAVPIVSKTPATLTGSVWSSATVSYTRNTDLVDTQSLLNTVSGIASDAYVTAHAAIPQANLIDNVTTNDGTKPLSARMGKYLEDTKLRKDFLADKIPGTTPGLLYQVSLQYASGNTNNYQLQEVFRNPASNTDSTTVTSFALADETQCGLMPKEDVQLLNSVKSDVENLKGLGRVAGNLGASPTQTQLTNYWKTTKNVTTVAEGATIVNLDQDAPAGHSWTYYETSPNVFTWVDRGTDVVNTASNTAKGIVVGSASTSGKVYVETDGSMSVNGWSATQSAITNLQNNKLNISDVNSAVSNAQVSLADNAASTTLPTTGTATAIKTLLDTVRANLKQLFGWHETSGAAKSATKLAAARTISIDSTSATASASFDGSANVTLGIPVALTDDTASNALPTTASGTLVSKLNALRANVKLLFSYFTGTSANSAVKLTNAHNLIVNLSSSSPASFDGTSDVRIGVDGSLGVSSVGFTTAQLNALNSGITANVIQNINTSIGNKIDKTSYIEALGYETSEASALSISRSRPTYLVFYPDP